MSPTKSKWEEIVLDSNDSYFYHSPSWSKIMEKTFNFHDSTRLYTINGKEILVPVMRKKKYGFNVYDSMPLGYGGFFSGDKISFHEIEIIIDKIMGGKNIIFNFTLSPSSNLSIDLKKSSVSQVNDVWSYTHILPLNNDFDYIWKNYFKRNTRRAIQKSERNNIEIQKGDSLNDFKDYYCLYVDASKKWGYETPEYPLRLFKNLYRFGSDSVDLYMAYRDSELIAGLISFSYGRNVSGWSNVFLSQYGALNPTSLLVSHSIECACKEGYKNYDLGASGDLGGVRKFKESFGPEMIKTNRFRAFSNIGKFIFNIMGAFK